MQPLTPVGNNGGASWSSSPPSSSTSQDETTARRDRALSQTMHVTTPSPTPAWGPIDRPDVWCEFRCVGCAVLPSYAALLLHQSMEEEGSAGASSVPVPSTRKETSAEKTKKKAAGAGAGVNGSSSSSHKEKGKPGIELPRPWAEWNKVIESTARGGHSGIPASAVVCAVSTFGRRGASSDDVVRLIKSWVVAVGKCAFLESNPRSFVAPTTRDAITYLEVHDGGGGGGGGGVGSEGESEGESEGGGRATKDPSRFSSVPPSDWSGTSRRMIYDLDMAIDNESKASVRRGVASSAPPPARVLSHAHPPPPPPLPHRKPPLPHRTPSLTSAVAVAGPTTMTTNPAPSSAASSSPAPAPPPQVKEKKKKKGLPSHI